MKDAVKVVIFVRIIPFLLALLLFSADGLASPSRETKRVLVLYSLDKGHPAHELTDQGIRAAFRSNRLYDIQVYAEYLDVARFSDPGQARIMADYLARKYGDSRIDAIITVYPQAAEFLLANKPAPFQGVPVIAAEIGRSFGDLIEHSPARRLITGQIIGNNVTGVLETALRVRPSTKHVAVVGGTTPNDEHSAEVIREGLRRYAARLSLIDLTKLPIAEILRRVGSLPPDAIVFYSSLIRDGAGQHFIPRDALGQIAAAANVPVFGLYESFMGFGIVGGPLISFEHVGKTAADLTLQVLSGKSPRTLPFAEDSEYITMFDWRELKRWGIPENTLPPGSTIINKKFSVWDSYKWYIIGTVAFCLVETFLVVLLVVSLRKRRMALRDLADSEVRYRTVADYTYDWEYWSAPDGKLLYMSPSCERITGYSPEQFVEDPSRLREIILPEDRPVWDTHYQGTEAKLTLREIQFRIRARDGNILWIDHASQPVIDRTGHFRGYRVSNRDVTERRKAELEAQQRRDELAHVTRVAAMGELTSSLAHELNQPLAAILNYANAAQRFLSGAEPDLGKVREALTGIARDDKRASEVIRKVRALLKKEEPHYTCLPMNSVIEETLALIKEELIRNRSTVVTDLDPGIASITGDRVQLQQVLLNLTINAVAAMRDVEPGLRILVIKTEKFEDKNVKVSVSDSGSGIDEVQKDRIFEPFYTTKSTGMGMGLAISQRIINAFGGSIWAENNPHGGATISFSVPMVAAGVEEEIRLAAEDGQVQTG